MKKKTRKEEDPKPRSGAPQSEQEKIAQDIDKTIEEMESGMQRLRNRLRRIQDKLGRLQQQLDEQEGGTPPSESDPFIWVPDSSQNVWTA